MLIHLVSYLLTHIDTDPLVAALLNVTLIHLLIAMNPDGYAVALRRSRGDCEGVAGR